MLRILRSKNIWTKKGLWSVVPPSKSNIESLTKIASFEQAELKLVHYIEPDMCSSCYLSKVLEYKSLFDLERESDKQFLNVFIVEPGKKNSNIRRQLYTFRPLR